MAKYQFGPFEFDGCSETLFKHGYRMKLQPKAARVLATLLETPGQAVGREQLKSRLWTEGTFVEFDTGINVAIRRLRDVLSDSADEPTYIQTVPGEGYRFIAPVSQVDDVLATPAATVSPAPISQRTIWRSAAVAVAAVALISAGFVSWKMLRPHPLLRTPGWVLIGNFENRTGQPTLDGALESAMLHELSNSQFVKVVPEQRVEDTLRLMRRPVDTRLDVATARQVCLRDGGIQRFLTGSVEKLGSTYVLSVQIVDPASGEVERSLSEDDPADTKMAGAVHRLSNRVRQTLGEQTQTIRQDDERLSKVTTPSLHALQLYTQADRLVGHFGGAAPNRIGIQVLEQAVREDPDFASAHALLGHAYTDDGRNEDAAREFQRAFELADRTSDRERYFILGSYYAGRKVNQPQKAVEAYETLLRMYPDDYRALQNLEQVYGQLHTFEKAKDMVARLAEARPNDIELNVEAAFDILSWQTGHDGQSKKIQPVWAPSELSTVHHYLDRALAVSAASGGGEQTSATDESPRLFASSVSWLEGDVARSRTYLQEKERMGTVGPAPAGQFYFTFGNLREAEQRLQRQDGNGYIMQALVAYYRGDLDAVRSYLHVKWDPDIRFGADFAGIMMVQSGMTREAEALRRILIEREKHPLRPGLPKISPVIEGEQAIAKGDLARAASVLQPVFAMPQGPAAVMTATDLAAAYRRRGQLTEAIRILEPVVRGALWVSFVTPFRMKAQYELAELYREVGLTQDAERIEAGLRRMLVFADPDHPLLRAMHERDHLAAAQTHNVISAAMTSSSGR